MKSKRPLVPVAVLLLAICLLLGGGALAVRTLGPTETPSASKPDPATEKPPLISGRKRPREFKLPEASLAFGFHSLDTNEPDGREVVNGTDQGSLAYSVRAGAAARILDLYRSILPKQGGVFERESRYKQSAEGSRMPIIGELTGKRLFWRRKDSRRRLTVLVLDYQQRGSTAQVAISWSTPEDEGAAPAGKTGEEAPAAK